MHSKKTHVAISLISLLGIAITIFLTYRHVQLFAGNEVIGCTPGAIFNCDAVEFSKYSEIWGIPTAAFGLSFYVMMLLLGFYGMQNPLVRRESMAIGFPIAGLASLAGIGLTILSYFVINALCSWCTVSHILTISLFMILAISFSKANENPFTILSGLFKGKSEGKSLSKKSGDTQVLKSQIIFISISALIAIVISLFANKPKSTLRDPSRFIAKYENLPTLNVETGDSPSTGRDDAPLTIVEFSDFQCPACLMAFQSLKPAVRRFPDQIRLVYKNFPLDMACNSLVKRNIHPFACLSAKGAICAGDQGGDSTFFTYHDQLFKNQKKINPELVQKIAKDLNLDMEEFGECLTAESTQIKLQSDIQQAIELGVAATPTLYVNGKKMEGALTREEFEVLIDHVKATQSGSQNY